MLSFDDKKYISNWQEKVRKYTPKKYYNKKKQKKIEKEGQKVKDKYKPNSILH